MGLKKGFNGDHQSYLMGIYLLSYVCIGYMVSRYWTIYPEQELLLQILKQKINKLGII